MCSQISEHHKKSMRGRRLALNKIISSIAYLGRQGPVLVGHVNESINFKSTVETHI